MNKGTLYIVATPIGNLGDITFRAVDILGQVDIILAEDTRHSQKLLEHYSIRTPLKALHEHNERQQADKLVQRLIDGQTLALISDAGTPLISDPGYPLVQACRQQGVTVVPIPGASALIAALSVAGLATDRFCFEGFLPSKSGHRQQRLKPLAEESRTLVFYESPHRIEATLKDMAAVFGHSRAMTLARELTKTYETVLSGSIAEVMESVQSDDNQRKGEMVLVIAGDTQDHSEESWPDATRLVTRLAKELPPKTACGIAAEQYDLNKKALYQWLIAQKE